MLDTPADLATEISTDFTNVRASTPPAASPEQSPPPLRPRGSNHLGMRQFNDRVVLQTLRQHGSLPKADLARLTGLTAQTIGLITNRLDDDDLLIRHDPVRGRIGQPSVPLALNPDGAFSIGVKIGRRSTEWLLVDFTGAVRARRYLHYAAPDAQTLLPALREHLDALSATLGDRAPRLLGVGVAAPFQLGGWHKMLGLSAAQSSRWNELDLATEVQNLTDLPVSYAKDTSAACVAELVSGRGHDLKSFLYLFVDTFVGGGLVINSHLHTGVHGNAGAVASVPLNVPDSAATPGHPGHPGHSPQHNVSAPEQLLKRASLWDLEQRYTALGLDPTAAYDARALQAPFNPETQIWLGSAALGLAHCIVSGTAFLDLDAVVIDASCCRALLQQLITQTQQALTHYSWEGLWPVKVVQGKVGPDAGALGGALLPLHAHFAPDHGLFLK